MSVLKARIKKITPNQWVFLCILLIGTILRFYNYFNLPYTYDEFSALFRTRFDNFSDLIDHGVKIDGHPAGVQVFLYYWVQLFGNDAWIVKLPFTILSVGSIFLIYQIGKQWRNETVGLLLAAFIASSQFFITYGTIARPYGSGVFLTLLLMLAITNLVLFPTRKFYTNLVVYTLSASACAYNHHFSMLTSTLLCLIGLFFIQRKFRLRYIVASVAALVLYIPHLPVLFAQLSIGGIGGPDGWLEAPTPRFLLSYFGYLNHYSIFPIILLIGLFILGLFKRSIINPYTSWLTISVSVFALTIIIGYYYSVAHNPVLQYSVLIFSTPFFYFAALGHIRLLSIQWNVLLTVLIISINTGTLIHRRHFSIYYSSVYIDFLNDVNETAENYGSPAMISGDMRIFNYYQKKAGTSIRFEDGADYTNNAQFLSYLDSISQHHDYFYFGEFFYDHPRLIPQIQRYFPHIVWQHNYISGTGYLFSKNGKRTQLAEISNWTPGKQTTGHWSEIDPQRLIDSAGTTYYVFDSLLEFGPQFNVKLEKIMQSAANLIDVELEIEGLPSGKDLLLVTQFTVGDSLMQWDGGSAKLQEVNGNCTRITQSYFLGKRHLLDDGMFRATIWNLEKQTFKVKKMTLYLREGNPVKYALTHPIERATTSALTHLPLR